MNIKQAQRTPGLLMTYEQWKRESHYDVVVAALREIARGENGVEWNARLASTALAKAEA